MLDFVSTLFSQKNRVLVNSHLIPILLPTKDHAVLGDGGEGGVGGLWLGLSGAWRKGGEGGELLSWAQRQGPLPVVDKLFSLPA